MIKTLFPVAAKALFAAFVYVLPLVALTVAPRVCVADVVEGIAAVVDGSVITRSEVRQALARVKASENDEKARDMILETLIESKLVDLQAERMGIVITPEEVETAVENVRLRNNLDKLTFRAELEKVDEGLARL